MPEARWLDEREEAAWRGLLQLYAQLTAELARRLAADSPLSYPDYEVLVALTDRSDGRLRVVDKATGRKYARPDEAEARIRALEEELARLKHTRRKRKGS